MKSVAIHAVLAVLGLGLAYQTWTREETPEESVGDVTMAECTRQDLVSLAVETPRYVNTVVPRKVDGKRVFWISHQRRPQEDKKPEKKPAAKPATTPAAAADGGAATALDAGASVADAGSAEIAKAVKPEPKPPLPKPEIFVTNDAFESYLKSVLPLRAQRSLGKIAEDRLPEFGFDNVDTFLRADCGGTKLVFEVGGRTYGTAKRYVRRKDTGEAFLVDGKVVQDLQSARYKFRQTDLHVFSLDDAKSAEVHAAGKQRKLVRRKLGEDIGARWVDAEAPDKRNELFGNWFARVAKLKVNTYLGDGEPPGSDLVQEDGTQSDGTHPDAAQGAGAGTIEAASEPAVQVSYVTKDDKPGRLELVVVKQGKTTHYYARTETTINWVKLYNSAAKVVVDDAPLVVGAEQAPETNAEDADSEAGSSRSLAPTGHPPLPPHGHPPLPPNGHP